MTDLEKLKESLRNLEKVLEEIKGGKKDIFHAAAAAKLFEVSFEHAWKALKVHVQKSGLEAYSPRDVIKVAGQMGIIDNVEKWLQFLEDRNLSVHDYIGIDDQDYLRSIFDFVTYLKGVLNRLKNQR